MNTLNTKYRKRVLVTGAAGFIGTNFLLYISPRYKDILWVNFDCLTYAANKDSLTETLKQNNVRFFKGDIRNLSDIDKVFREYKITDVINFAAESHVDTSIKNPGEFITTNVVGTHNLLQVALKYWSQSKSLTESRFHQISTDEVFGSIKSGFFTEGSPIAPRSPYSASKASADAFVFAYHETFNLNTTISNCSNNFGPWQHQEKLIPKIISHAINNKPIPIYGSGLQVRDWLFVLDHVKAIEKIFFNAPSGSRWVIGGKCEKTNLEIVRAIFTNLEKKLKKEFDLEKFVQHIEDRPGHDFRYAINPAKISKELGFIPQTSFEDGIALTVEWYLR